MDIKSLFKKSHKIAKAKGWWSKKRSPLEVLMLINCELAEAAEEFRKGTEPMYLGTSEVKKNIRKLEKPEGFLVELADALIRMGDFIEHEGLTEDFLVALKLKQDYNKTRSVRHGGKKY